MAAEGGVPVWGIEAGDRTIRAIRLAPRESGGFLVLDYREEATDRPGPEALVSFLRRRGLKRHPVAIAILSPASTFRSVRLAPDDLARPRDDMRATLADYVHPEPEGLDFRWTVIDENLYFVSAEERPRVESYMIALEREQVATYSLLAGSQALHAGVRRSGLLSGDGVVVRVLDSWTELLFLDGEMASRQAIPLGRRDLDETEKRRMFADDLGRLLEYHRTRYEREEPERFVLLGLAAEASAAVAEFLPTPPVLFPEDAAPVRGGRGLSLLKALEHCRSAPAGVGAALGAVSSPRNEELSLRPFPDVLPPPPAPAGSWFVAAAILWIALGVAFIGLSRDRDRLKTLADRAPPSGPVLTETHAATLEDLLDLARRRLAFPVAAAKALQAIPGAEAAPFRTERIGISGRLDGGYEVDLVIELGDAEADSGRARDAAARFTGVTGAAVRLEATDGKLRIQGTFRVEGEE